MISIEDIKQPEFEPDPELTPMAEKLREMIDAAKRVAAFTGAGASAESGIPTYRGAGGLWSKYDPDKFASIDYFRRDPTYYWTFFRDARHDLITKANPNLSHYALAELERRGKLSGVITQNIDGLHLRAGSKRVLELHGNTRRFYCTRCKKEYTIDEVWEMVQVQLPVYCGDCNRVVRPDVVMYGEMLPPDTVMQAERETNSCDLMLMIGSSLITYPAANLPYRAKMSGAKVAIINIDPTPMDSMADFVAHCPAANLMGQVVWS